MVMLSEIPKKHGTTVTGIFMACNPLPKIARNGTSYLRIMLKDASATLPAYVWPDEYWGPELIAHEQTVQATLRFEGDWVHILDAEPVPISSREIELFSGWSCPRPELLPRLVRLVRSIDTPPLHHMLTHVLRDPEISPHFLTLPASHHHHHSYPSGLLQHSLEMCEFIQAVPSSLLTGQHIRDLGIVAALFHDIGKVMTFNSDGARTMHGKIIDHELLSLEILAPYLKRLGQVWENGALALRHILTPQLKSNNWQWPMMPLRDLVRFADNFSAKTTAADMAFDGVPDWQQVARLNEKQYFYRLKRYH